MCIGPGHFPVQILSFSRPFGYPCGQNFCVSVNKATKQLISTARFLHCRECAGLKRSKTASPGPLRHAPPCVGGTSNIPSSLGGLSVWQLEDFVLSV